MATADKKTPESRPSAIGGAGAVTIETVPIDSLCHDPANVRKHPERNIAAIRASLRRFGQQRPILVSPRGFVIAGNGTMAAAKAEGWTEIKIQRTTLDGAEATAYAIADNRTAELAEWDDEALAAQLSAITIDDAELAHATGFDEGELAKLVAGFTVPNFEPVGEDEQGRLDQKAPTVCPKCGHQWTA